MAVDVPADGDWRGYRLHIGLFEEDLFGLFAQDAKVLLVEALGLKEVGNALVDVHLIQIFSNYQGNNYKTYLEPLKGRPS